MAVCEEMMTATRQVQAWQVQALAGHRPESPGVRRGSCREAVRFRSVADVDPAQPRAPRRANPLPDDAAGIERSPVRTEAVPAVPVAPMRGRGRTGGERSRADGGGSSEREGQF